MKKIRTLFLIVLSLTLFSCDSIKQGLGIEKSTPDEFLVEKRKKISLPPDYNLLPPGTMVIEKDKNNQEENLKSIINNQISEKKDLKNETSEYKASSNNSTENKILTNIK